MAYTLFSLKTLISFYDIRLTVLDLDPESDFLIPIRIKGSHVKRDPQRSGSKTLLALLDLDTKKMNQDPQSQALTLASCT